MSNGAHAGSEARSGRTKTMQQRGGVRLRRFTAIASAVAVGVSVLALPTPAAAQVIIPGATTFTEPFDDDNETDFARTTAEWNDGFLSLPEASPTFNGLQNNAVQVSADIGLWADLAVGDVDGDGNDDVVAVRDGVTRWYAGTGTDDPFSGVSGIDIGTDLGQATDVELADIDGDGDLDVLVIYPAGTPGLVVHANDGTSTPFAATAPRTISNAVGHTQVVAGYFDDDTDIDIVTAGQDIWYFRNQGEAEPFSVQFPVIVTNDNVTRLVATDLNRDGELDLVAGTESGDVRWYGNNDGATAFSTSAPFDLVRSGTGAAIDELAVGDLDFDGQLEVFIEDSGEPSSLIGFVEFGGPERDFVDSGTQAMASDIGQNVTDVELVDVDNDGKRDIVQVVNDGTTYRNRWFRNTGEPEWWVDAAFEEQSRSTQTFLTELAIADFDRDGDLDSFVAASGSPTASFDILRFYENIGSPIPLADPALSSGVVSSVADVASLDIDADGDVDYVVSPGTTANVSIYRNDGSGGFATSGFGGNGVSIFGDLDVGDANLDGRADVAVVANEPDPADNRILVLGSIGNPGASTILFSTPSPYATSVQLADVDGDGADDLVVGTDGTVPSSWRINDRVGLDFYDSNPVNALGGSIGISTLLLDAGDMDGDGLDDLLVSTTPGSQFAYYRSVDLANRVDVGAAAPADFGVFYDDGLDGDLDVAVQDATGGVRRFGNFNGTTISSFGIEVVSRAGSADGLAAQDLDGDGRADFVLNDSGTLVAVAADGVNSSREVGTGSQAFVVGDFDGDGDEDVQSFLVGQARRLDNISQPVPTAAVRESAQFVTDAVLDIAPIDLERDGDVDIITVGSDGVVLYDNAFGARFPFSAGNSTLLRADTDYTQVASGDIDNDGDIDAVAAKDDGQLTLFRSDGDGAIEQVVDLVFDATVSSADALELADMNRDGDLDVVVLQDFGTSSQVRTLINVGGGLFPGATTTFFGIVPAQFTDMSLADIDRDGDPDVVLASQLADGHQVVINDGGTLGSQEALTTPVAGPTSVDLGDIDGDGYPDIVFGQENGDTVVFLNVPANGGDFTGAVAATVGSAPLTTANEVKLADVDGDGLLDLVAASSADGLAEVAYGDGTTAFDGGLSTIAVGGSFSEIAAFELDPDRGLEIVVYNGDNGEIVTSQNPVLLDEAGNQAYSNTVVTTAIPITQAAVRFDAAESINPNEVDVWLSNNFGENWFHVEEGETFDFPTAGTELFFRTEFADDRLWDDDTDPRQLVDTLNIEYLAQIPLDPTVGVTLTVAPDLADSGPSAVPLDALAPEVLQDASDDGANSDIAALPLSSIDLLPSDDPNIQASPLSSIPLSSIPLSSLPLSSIPLSDVPIDAPGGWDGVLERARAAGETELIGAPLQNVTFADVAELSEVQALPLSSIDLAATPLSSIPLSSIALGATPLSSIDIGPFPEAWCDLLESPDFGFDCAADFGINAGDTETDVNIVDLAVEGAPLSSIPLSSVPLSSLPLSSLPLSSIPLSSVELDSTPLSSIPLSSIPLSSIELQASPLSSIPLSSIPLSSIPLSSIPLSSLDLAGTPLSSVPLSSIDIAGSPLSSIPLSSLDLAALPLSSIPLSSVPLSSLPLSSLPLSSVFVSGVPLSSVPLSSIDIAGSPLSSIPLSSIDIAGSPLSSVPLSSLPLSSVPLSSVPLSSVDIAGSPLSSIPLSSVDIAGSPLSSIPLSSIVLIDDVVDCSLIDCDDERNALFQAVLNNAIRPGAELGDLEGSFGDTRHDDLVAALTGVDREVYDQAVRNALDAGPASVLSDLLAQGRGDGLVLGDLPSDLVELQSTPFVVLLAGLAGFDYADLGALLGDVTLGGDLVDFTDVIDVDDATLGELLATPDQNPPAGPFFDQVTLDDIADAFTGLRLADLAAIFGINEAQLAQDLNGITGTLADVTEFDDLTLGELLVYGGATLDDLFAALALADPPVLDAIVLGELLVGLLAVTDYPWDIVDFAAEDLVEFDDTSSNVEYTALVTTADAPGETVELRVTLPPGSPYVPGSTSFSAVGDADPEIQGADLVWTFQVNGTGTADLVTFEARPPLNLATHPAEATARLLDSEIEASSISTFELLEANEPNDTPATATSIVEGNAYFAHISSSDDIDLFSITVPAVGSRLSINLSNLDADLDLALFAPEGGGFLGAEPQDSIVPVDDDGINALDNDDEVDAQVAQDLALADLPLHQTSLQRGLGDEQIDTAPLNRSGTWYIQVTGFNGATTLDPYVLRAKVLAPIAGVPCAARSFPFSGTPGAAAPIGTDVDTIFLLNEERLGAVYGPAEAASIRTRLDDLVRSLTAPAAGDPDLTGLGVTPAIVPVESNAAVASAYDAWDAASGACSPDAANDVVSAISDVVEGIRSTNELRHVVVVGGDELVPFARVPDATTIANERSYASTFSGENNALVGALAGGFVLTDDVYADADPIAFGDRTLYVPDIAAGRLVETPAEIIGTLDGFLGHGGTLDPDTGLVTGYDFLTDGADAIIEELEGAITGPGGIPLDPNVLNNDVWGRADLRDALVPAAGDGPDVASVNAHFDHYRSLPADGNASKDESDLFEVSDLAQGIPGGLEGSIIFSMGCHSGFTVNDELVPFGDVRAGDWAQAFATRGAIYVGNTGYGYGDTEIVAYSEELMARFAGNLDGSVTAGEALMFAKNSYIGGLAAVGVYDEKSAMQATFYGLPFYSIDEVAPPPPPAPVVVPEPDPLAADIPSAGIELELDGEFERVDGPDGTYWFWNDEGAESTQAVHFRPIQPKVVADVTPADPTLEARGAILTDLASLDVPGIDPVIVRPTIDLSSNEPEPDAGQIADPAVLQTVSAEFTPEGDRQRLVTSGGQFDGTAEQGTQRLFTTIDADIYYADVNDPDRLPPVIESIDGVELGGDVIVNVEVSDESSNVVRVVMLYVVDPGPGVTESWDLVEFARDPATGTWSAAVPNPGGEIEYFVQALDAAGNVAVSSDKGLLYEAADVAPPPADLTPALARPADSNGWYTSAVTVDIPDPSPFTVQVSISGGEPFAYEGPVTVSTSGNRRVEFRRNDGLVAEVFVSVDLALPASTISTPVPGAQIPFGQPVVTSFSCSDVGSGIETCTATLDGAPVQSGSTRDDLAIGPHTLVVTSTDIAGNSTQSTRTFDVVADVTPPTATITSPADGALVPADVTVDFDCTDELPGVTCTAVLDGQPVADGATVTLASGASTLVVTAVDAAGNSADATSNFTVDADAPIVSITSPADGAEFDFPASITIDFDCTDPNLTSCTATLDGDPVDDGDVVTDLELGEHTVVATGVDEVGNSASVSSIFTIGDDSAPTIDITSPTDGSVVGTEVTFGFTCSDNVPAGLTCEGEVDGATAVDDGDTLTLASGSHTLVVTATDAENNTATASSTFTVVENIAPVVSIDQPTDGATFGLAAGGSIDIAATCSDAGSGMDFCTLTFDGDSVGTPGITSASASIDVSTAGLGQHTIAVTGADLDGNTDTASITITVVDDLAPTITISSPSDGDTFATGEEFTVTFDCSDESGEPGCTALLDGVAVESGDVVSFVTPGQRTLVVDAVDQAGNTTQTSVSVTIEDQTDPTVTITAPGAGATVTSPVTFVFDCADELAGVTCTGVVDPGTVDAVSVSTGVPVAISLGAHTLVVTAEDAAGNTATDSRTFTVSDDNPPLVTIDEPADGATFGLAAGGSIDISATCTDDGAGMDSCALTFDGDAVGTPGTTSASASVDVSTAGVGDHTITVTGTDLDGNVGIASITITVIDDVDPTISISSPSDGDTFATGEEFTVTFDCADESGAADCTASIGGDEVESGDTVSFDTPGAQTLTVDAVDQAGNTTQASVSVTIEDQTDPTVTITAPGAGATVTSPVTFVFDCADELAGVTCTGVVDPGTVDAVSVSTGVPVAISLGEHTLVVTATDAAGNTATDSRTFTVSDDNPPVVTIDEPADGATFGLAEGGSIDISATCTDDGAGMDSCALTFDGDAVGTPGTTSASASVDVSTAGVGDHTITVTGTDLDGNVGVASITITVIDDVDPTITISSPSDGDTFATGEEFTVTFDCTDESGAADCTASIGGDEVESGDTVSFDTPGAQTLTVDAVDQAGNTTQTSVSVTIEDQTDPTVTITAPGAGATVTSPVTFVFDCADELAGVTCTGVVDPGTVDAVSVSTGVPVAISLGEHTLVVTATDAAGNTATDSRTFTVSENTPPAVSIDEPADGATFGLAAGGSIDIVANCDDDGAGMDTCALTFDGDPVGIPGSIMAIASIPVADAGVGAHTITVTGTDLDGNVGVASITVTVVDDVAPEVTEITPADGAFTGADVTITFDCADDAVSCIGELDGQTVATGTELTLAEGPHVLVVTATDAAGNEAQAQSDFVVDATAPVVAITAPLDGAEIPETDPVIVTFSCTEAPGPLASGVDACVGVIDGNTTVQSGDSLDDLAVGAHTLVVTGTDGVGNEAEETVSFEVTEVLGIRRVLFVSRAAQPPASDRPVIELLTEAGYEVEVVDDRRSRVSDAEGKDVIVISASVVASQVGSRFRDIDVPVVSWEGFLHAPMGFNRFGFFRSGETLGRFYRSVDIASPDHPVAAGLDGRVTVNDTGRRQAFSRPEGDAVIVGTLPGSPNLATVFAYEEGAAMRGDLTAPARRVGLFMDAQGTARLTADGEAIVLAALDWATRPPVPFNLAPEVDLGADVDTTVSVPVDLTAIVTDDALPTADAPSVAWRQVVGPGTATFTSDDTVATNVSFDAVGVYVLELAADDGERTAADRVRVTVAPDTVTETILYVGANASPNFVDRITVGHFESLGYTVVSVSDNSVRQNLDLTGIDLVFVSTTVAPWLIRDAFADVAVPLILNERLLLDDFGMAGPPIRTRGPIRDLQIEAPEHPLAAGFEDSVNFVRINTRVGMGVPSDEAVVAATAFGMAVLFGYETGDEMVGRAAPANRVFFPGTNVTPVALNDNGFALLTQAVNVALS